jgi:hypothetical protein
LGVTTKKQTMKTIINSGIFILTISFSSHSQEATKNHNSVTNSTINEAPSIEVEKAEKADTTELKRTYSKKEKAATPKGKSEESFIAPESKKASDAEMASPIPSSADFSVSGGASQSFYSSEAAINSFSNSNYDLTNSTTLFTVAKQQPENIAVQKQLMAYYVITNQNDQFDSIAEKVSVKENRKDSDYAYFEDVCSSVSENSTLILHGVTDFNLNFQKRECYTSKNIELISFEYLPSKNYQQQLINKGFILPQKTEYNPDYIKEFCELNQSKNIYLSMTFPKDYFKPIQKNIVPVGLTFHYGYTTDPNTTNIQLWEKDWKTSITAEQMTSFSDGLSKNYIPTLLVLRNYYKQLGFLNEVQLINEKIELIGKRANIPQETIESLKK